MSYEQERDDIETHFLTEWTTTTKIRWDNVKWDNPAEDPSWVALTIITDEADQISLGDNPRYRFPGMVIVQVFVKEGTGTGVVNQLADQVVEAFRLRTLGTAPTGFVKFQTPWKRREGVKNGWFQMNVFAPYQRDECLPRP